MVITSSFGHIFDLNKEVGYFGVLENGKFIPVYETIEGKENIVNALREASKEFDQILVATDPDTEGEKYRGILKIFVLFLLRILREWNFMKLQREPY